MKKITLKAHDECLKCDAFDVSYFYEKRKFIIKCEIDEDERNPVYFKTCPYDGRTLT